MDTTKLMKAWLNYNCSQGNNWVVMYQFDQIVNHHDRQCFRASGKNMVELPIDQHPILTAQDLRHIYFTYMTDKIIISVFETLRGQLFMVKNQMTISEAPTTDKAPETPQLAEQTIELTDEAIDQMLDNQDIKKVDEKIPLPQVVSIESKLIQLDQIKSLAFCLSKKEKKQIGIKDTDWLGTTFKKSQRDELAKISFMDFIRVDKEDEYVALLNQLIDQVSSTTGTLNLTHNYTVTPALLKQVKPNTGIKQVIIYQNFQIDDLEWLEKFPNLKLLNFFYSHQLEQRHFEQLTTVAPHLQVLNIHYCARINVRILIPIFKLRELEKLAIEDQEFWCQKSIHELFITPKEWKSMDSPSIQKIAINSHNLTLDIIDYLLTACPNVTQFTVDEEVMKSVNTNIESGCERDAYIVFNAWQNPQKGFQIHKKVHFKNLMKDNYNKQMFSDSMLKKIKEMRAHKGEQEQTPLD